MSLKPHLESLQHKHDQLKKKLHGLEVHSHADAQELNRLKKEKLELKDKIEQAHASSQNDPERSQHSK